MDKNTVCLEGIDHDLQKKAEIIFGWQGRTAAEVYRNLLLRTVEEQHTPLDLFPPNAETLEAFQEARRGCGKTFGSVEEMMADLNAEE